MRLKIFVMFFLLTSNLFSQILLSDRFYSKVVLFPNHRLYPSNFSDPFEAEIGTKFFLDTKNLELNIGAAKDIIHYKSGLRNTFGFGLEFFNWTLLNREKEFRFPVRAVDYFFGGYFVFYHNSRYLDWVNRIRISHISAHLSDGNFDNLNNQWINNQNPFTYSREFVQWTSAFLYRNINLYFDVNYIFHSIPALKSNTIFGAGSEAILIGFPKLVTKIFTGFDLKFQKLLSNKFETNKNFSVGFIFGNEHSTHFRLAFQYYNGYHLYGQFYSKKLEQSFINISLVI